MKAPAKAHSNFGASVAHRFIACPGSVRLCATVPNTGSVYAAEGTAAHALAQHCLEQRDAAANYIGETFEKFVVTKDMADAVQVYLDRIESLFDEAAGDELNVEHKFTLSHIADDCFGTNDCSIYKPSTGELYVDDYKHGAGHAVEVKDNAQLLYYALGAATRYGNRPIRRVIIAITQPRCYHPDGPVRSMVVDAVTLLEWGEDLRDAVELARKPDAPLHSGSHCKFCPAAATCPELHRKALDAASSEFGEVATVEEVSTYSPIELRDRLLKVSAIELWAKAVRRHAFEQGLAGNIPEGFKFVAKVGRRKFLNESAALLTLEAAGIPTSDVTKLASPAQVEKAIGKENYKLVAKESSGFNLVPVTAKGEAVTPDPTAEFSDVDF